MTLWDYAWPANPDKAVTLTHNTFVIIVDGGELKGAGPDGKPGVQTVSSGQVLFRAAGTTFAEVAAKGPVHAVLVEVK